MDSKHPTAGLGLVLTIGLVLGVGLLFGVAGCPTTQPGGGGPPAEGCTTNDDCPEGHECVDGECVTPEPVACETNDDCDDGEFCNGAETCVDRECQAGTVPCAEGQTCNEETDQCEGAGAVEFPYETVEFDHDFHMTAEGLTCTDCHHTEPNAAGQACSVCHLDEWIGGVPKLKEAEHWTCRTCHDDRAGERVRCDTCHTQLLDL